MPGNRHIQTDVKSFMYQNASGFKHKYSEVVYMMRLLRVGVFPLIMLMSLRQCVHAVTNRPVLPTPRFSCGFKPVPRGSGESAVAGCGFWASFYAHAVILG